MALSNDEKVIRRKVVGTAIRLLREHLGGISQPRLAVILGGDTDPVT